MKTILRKIIYFFYDFYIIIFNLSHKLFFASLKLEVISGNISFFGYYLKSPENLSGQILFQTATGEAERQSIHESSSVYLIKNNIKSLVYKTKAWNWQQGSMLQWLPNNEKCIIND